MKRPWTKHILFVAMVLLSGSAQAQTLTQTPPANQQLRAAGSGEFSCRQWLGEQTSALTSLISMVRAFSSTAVNPTLTQMMDQGRAMAAPLAQGLPANLVIRLTAMYEVLKNDRQPQNRLLGQRQALAQEIEQHFASLPNNPVAAVEVMYDGSLRLSLNYGQHERSGSNPIVEQLRNQTGVRSLIGVEAPVDVLIRVVNQTPRIVAGDELERFRNAANFFFIVSRSTPPAQFAQFTVDQMDARAREVASREVDPNCQRELEARGISGIVNVYQAFLRKNDLGLTSVPAPGFGGSSQAAPQPEFRRQAVPAR